MIESMTPDQQVWARSFPGWIHFLNGLAVFTGAWRSVGLVMRKGWAVLLLVISLVAVIVHMSYTMIIAGGLEVMGPSGAIMSAVVIVIAGFLAWFSHWAKGKSWLGA